MKLHGGTGKGQMKIAGIIRHSKKALNKSSYVHGGAGAKVGSDDNVFSFDNKENQSINYNEFSPSRIIGKHGPGGAGHNMLDSDSSLSSPQTYHH
jgi:hypothetical protein